MIIAYKLFSPRSVAFEKANNFIFFSIFLVGGRNLILIQSIFS